MRSAEGILNAVEKQNVQQIHKLLNSFEKNIKFTFDSFSDRKVHFLDIQIDKNHTNIIINQNTLDSRHILKVRQQGS